MHVNFSRFACSSPTLQALKLKWSVPARHVESFIHQDSSETSTTVFSKMSFEAMKSWPAIAIAIILYLLLIRLLRYRYINGLQQRFPTRQSLAKMTLDEAWQIQHHRASMEHPDISFYATFFSFCLHIAINQIKLNQYNGKGRYEGSIVIFCHCHLIR